MTIFHDMLPRTEPQKKLDELLRNLHRERCNGYREEIEKSWLSYLEVE